MNFYAEKTFPNRWVLGLFFKVERVSELCMWVGTEFLAFVTGTERSLLLLDLRQREGA